MQPVAFSNLRQNYRQHAAGPHLKQLEHVVPDVIVHQRWVQHFEVGVVDILKHEAGRLGLGISHHVQQLDDIGAPTQVLQDLDFPLDLQQGRG